MGNLGRAIATVLIAIGGAVTAPARAAAHEPRLFPGVAIEAFDVEEVPRLVPGARLAFTLFGTPGAEAQVRIEGADSVLWLQETHPGIYDGAYTVGPRERIEPRATVIGSLRIGDEVARARLEEPLVLAALPSPAVVAPRVADPPLMAGDPRQAMPAAPENEPSATPLHAAPRNAPPEPFPHQRNVPPPPDRRLACSDCAVVESVQTVITEAGPDAVGAVIGGVTGAILGNRIADRAQRSWATLAGAIGGALAGRAIVRGASVPVRYEVWLRFPDGTRQLRSYSTPPPYRAGDLVRLPPLTLGSAARRALRD